MKRAERAAVFIYNGATEYTRRDYLTRYQHGEQIAPGRLYGIHIQTTLNHFLLVVRIAFVTIFHLRGWKVAHNV
jgi:hypothetical protein